MVHRLAVSKVELLLSMHKALRCSDFQVSLILIAVKGEGGGARGIVQLARGCGLPPPGAGM